MAGQAERCREVRDMGTPGQNVQQTHENRVRASELRVVYVKGQKDRKTEEWMSQENPGP